MFAAPWLAQRLGLLGPVPPRRGGDPEAGADEASAWASLEWATGKAIRDSAEFVLCDACRIDPRALAAVLPAAAGAMCAGGADPDAAGLALRAGLASLRVRPAPGVTPLRRQTRDWGALTSWRVGQSYRRKRADLVWLYDKAEQAARVSRLAGRMLHLPTLGSEASAADLAGGGPGSSTARAAAAAGPGLEEAATRVVASKQRCCIKTLNGSGGQNVLVCAAFAGAGAAAEAAAARALVRRARALALADPDRSEPWQMQQVPRGVLLQPVYSSGVAVTESSVPGRLAPLELKVHVMFGTVLGATLHTHPWPVKERGTRTRKATPQWVLFLIWLTRLHVAEGPHGCVTHRTCRWATEIESNRPPLQEC